MYNKKSEKVMEMKRFKLLQVVVLTLLGLVNAQWAKAQDVTIKATNGSMIAAVPEGSTEYDTFFKVGGFATWQHEQLSMAFTTSDETGLTSSGQLANPANNLFSDGTHIQIAKGYNDYATCYLSVSLPKGYRFTEYTIKFSKPGQTTKSLSGNSVVFNSNNVSSTFGETGGDFSTFKTSASVGRGGDAQIITRTSQTEGDMDNVLYFKLYNETDNSGNRSIITLESAVFYFTSEANYTPLTVPGSAFNVSAIDIPFTTSKVDYGTISRRTYNGATRVSYSSSNVKDLTANFTLYEAGSIKTGEDFDGVSGYVVDYKEGSISVEGDYYRIGAADASNPGTEEHIYYIETPSYVVLADGTTKNPVGFRIIGAKIDYKYGPTNVYGETPITINIPYDRFYIYYNGRVDSYLTASGGSTLLSGDRALWFQDDEGYIRLCSGNSPTNEYLTTNNGTTPTTTTTKTKAKVFTIDANGIYYKENGTNHYLYREGGLNIDITFTTGNNRHAEISKDGQVIVPTPSTETGVIDTKTGGYTLKVYDKTGTSADDNTVTVNESNAEGTITLSGLNNDAIKIGVIGTGLIQGTLTLQALDPYLNSMDVVCQDKEEDQDIRLTQTFTASDFSVNGGEFYFFLPEDLKDKKVGITFENLKSEYFDETYTGGSSSHNSRINFVNSEHYNAFTSTSAPYANIIYNDAAEAANASKDRLTVGILGTQPFKFNNAAELSSTAGILTEYPFSLEKYADEPNNGTFESMEFTVSTEDQSKDRYVFTTDETRYNIAPTTAVQHRAYAYYKMIVHVITATYEPKVAFNKIYSKTFYNDTETNENKEDAFYGVTVTATDGEGKPGFASLNAIFARIDNIINTTKVDDSSNTDLPSSTNQILNIDLSGLQGIYVISDETHHSLSDFTSGHAANCLIFLPKGSSAHIDNVAFKTEAGTFQSANNIILTDKNPFYSPYDISVGSTNYAMYTRKITKSSYAAVQYATVFMPFTITLNDDGQHVDSEYGIMKFLQMNGSNATSNNLDYLGEVDVSAAFFKKTEDDKVKANTPYALEIVSKGNSSDSFTLRQYGSNIEATPNTNNMFSAEPITSSGELTDREGKKNNYTFSHVGSFSGSKVNRNEYTLFYFGNNGFYSSADLKEKYTTVDLFPFRSVYQATSTDGGSAKVGFLMLVEGENPDMATGITDLDRVFTGVTTGHGFITVTSDADATYRIRTVSGQHIGALNLKAGETRTVNVPAGIYLVNGLKVLVK